MNAPILRDGYTYSYIRSGSEIYGDVQIGRFSSIANNVLIGLNKNQHPSTWLTTSLFCRELEKNYFAASSLHATVVGHDCWIGRDAIIMSGLTLGIGSIIAARAVVTKNVPPYAIAIGAPAKIIKYRFDDTIREKLLNSHWWNIEVDTLKRLPLQHVERSLDLLSAPKKQVNYRRFDIKTGSVKIM